MLTSLGFMLALSDDPDNQGIVTDVASSLEGRTHALAAYESIRIHKNLQKR